MTELKLLAERDAPPACLPGPQGGRKSRSAPLGGRKVTLVRESHKIIATRVGTRLKWLRGSMTQAEFAAVLGIRQSQYSRYETGERLAPDALLEKAARFKGISPQELLWGPEPRPQEPPADPARAIAQLVRLMDEQDRQDLYHYLKLKLGDLGRKRRRLLKEAEEALDTLLTRAG